MILRLIRASIAGVVEIQGYLPEVLQSMHEFYPSSSVCDGDNDASEEGRRAPEDSDQDQEMHTASSGKPILASFLV